MTRLSRELRQRFAQWGQQGGEARKRSLSPLRRTTIARQAASIRWHAPPRSLGTVSIRLHKARWDNPGFLEEILSEGTRSDWQSLYQRITEHPFGPTALAIQKVLNAVHIYGVTAVWKGLLRHVQETA